MILPCLWNERIMKKNFYAYFCGVLWHKIFQIKDAESAVLCTIYKQPGTKHLHGKIELRWFAQCTLKHRKLVTTDITFLLLKIVPLKIFDLEISCAKKVPGWSVYHASLSVKINKAIA